MYLLVLAALASALLAVGAVLVALMPDLRVSLLVAVLGVVPLAQVGYVLHDAAHGSAFRRRRGNALLALFAGNFVSGVSQSWWAREHNAHHGSPNVLDTDPAIRFPILAFDERQLTGRSRFAKFVIRHQAAFFVPLIAVQPYNMRRNGITYLLSARPSGWRLELTAIAGGAILYYGFVFHALGLAAGALFVLVNQGLLGIYLGLSFAINHKGMPILDPDTTGDFLWSQVVTARDVRLPRVGHMLLGGASLQIEHHLFPTMTRGRLTEVQPIVKQFCAARGIPYKEVGLLRSYADVFRHLHDVGAPLRRAAAGG